MKLPSFIVLLRIPFSYYLMPVFFFAFSFCDYPDLIRSLQLFFILHVLVYPASNGYNSYMDKDTTPIGGLKNPPPPTVWLFVVTTLLNIAAIAWSYWLAPELSLLVTAYILVSISYSWHPIRLKKYAITSFASVAVFQGFVVFTMVYLFGQKVDYLKAMAQTNYLEPALISSLMVAGAYPMTQVYQHIADKKSGDMTISRILGIRGTFQFSAAFHGLVAIWMGFFLTNTNQSHLYYLFLCFVFPVLAFYLWWGNKVWENPDQANFRYTMMLNRISATAMVLYFVLIYFIRSTNELPV